MKVFREIFERVIIENEQEVHEDFVPETIKRISAKSLFGESVENTDGETIAGIKDIMVDVHSGHIDYIVLKYNEGILSGGKLFAFPFSEFVLDPVEDKFFIDKTKEELKNEPGFDTNHWPDTNSHSNAIGDVWNTFFPPDRI